MMLSKGGDLKYQYQRDESCEGNENDREATVKFAPNKVQPL